MDTQQESCLVVGCISHTERTVSVDNNEFAFKVHFTSSGDLLKHAAESVGRKLQAHIRASLKANGGVGFPMFRIVDILSDLSHTKTVEDEVQEILSLSPEQVAARKEYFAEMLRRLA